MDIHYVTRREDGWCFGKKWHLTSLEDGEIYFLTEWVQDERWCRD